MPFYTQEGGLWSETPLFSAISESMDSLGGSFVADLVRGYFLIIPESKMSLPVGVPLPVQFRPNELKFKTESKWESAMTYATNGGKIDRKGGKSKDAGYVEFAGSEPAEFSMTLFYDTTEWALPVKLWTEPVIALSMKWDDLTGTKATPPLLAYYALASKEDLKQPPIVKFWYGLHITKWSYVSEAEVTYSMFHPLGFAMRAEIEITLVPYEGKPSKKSLLQNPTSHSEARKTYTVQIGDTLDLIAAREYGSSEYWRHIADVNNLRNPMQLKSGRVLQLPPID